MPIEKRMQDNLSTVATLVTGAEAPTTKSQSIAAAETQEATSATDGTFANAKVPDKPQALAVQAPIVPLAANSALTFLGVKPDIKDMTLDEKFTCLKQCFAYGCRDQSDDTGTSTKVYNGTASAAGKTKE